MTDDGPSVRDETTEDDIVTRPGCVLTAIYTAWGTTQLLTEAEYKDPNTTILVSSNLAVENTGPPSTEPSDIGKCVGGGME